MRVHRGECIRKPSAKLVDGKLVGVPTGGPYSITCTVESRQYEGTATVGPVFVGDLWVLAGQSNMEGVGNLLDMTPPNPKVMLLGSNGKWPGLMGDGNALGARGAAIQGVQPFASGTTYCLGLNDQGDLTLDRDKLIDSPKTGKTPRYSCMALLSSFGTTW